MTILITEKHESQYSTTIEATAGKTTGVVSVNKRDGSMQVLCLNAAHRAFRGGGRYCRNLAEALEAYRSGEMKAIIRAAHDEARQMKEAA